MQAEVFVLYSKRSRLNRFLCSTRTDKKVEGRYVQETERRVEEEMMGY